MTLEAFLGTLATVLLPLVAAAWPIVRKFKGQSERLDRMDLNNSTLWDFIIQRARAELVTKGLAAMNSPLSNIDPKVKEAYRGMIAELKDFYRRTGVMLTEQQLFIEVQRRFGERITREICIPFGLNAGGCITLAVELAREAE